jgi:uncharacterized protein YceH (UPF0502 family)
MIPQLSALEARVIGSLIEKQITTPEQYPLSLNALLLACNQKSNRDPIIELSDREVQALIDGLARKHLVLEKSGFGSRVAKYQQRFCNTEFSSLQFTPQERAIVCELLLRGPQTPGELRARASRMAEFTDVSQVEAALDHLAQHASGACVVRLAREPGRREARFAHLFSGDAATTAAAASAAPAGSTAIPGAGAPNESTGTAAPLPLARLTALELQVQELRAELRSLRERLGG